MITGNLTLSNIDGFRGEWVKVRSSDDSFLQCTIDGWIDGDNTIPNENNVPKYQEFSCSYQSKYNMGYVSQGNECKVILLWRIRPLVKKVFTHIVVIINFFNFDVQGVPSIGTHFQF